MRAAITVDDEVDLTDGVHWLSVEKMRWAAYRLGLTQAEGYVLALVAFFPVNAMGWKALVTCLLQTPGQPFDTQLKCTL